MDTTEWKATACILCECNCGLEVQLGGADGRRLVRIRGDKRHPSSRGYACEKPHRLDHYQNGRDRLTTPLRRRGDGTFEPIDWDTAIREVAARLARVRDVHGGDKIFYYGGGGQGNHLPGAYSSATRRALDSRYRSSALAQEKTGEFWVSERMMGGATRADFEHCDVALFLGKNPWHSHSIARARVVLKELARDPDRTLIVVDPRKTETAELADIHLRVRPGTDAHLMAALVATLLRTGGVDAAFLEAHARPDELEALRAHFAAVDVAACCARAGVPVEQVEEAAAAIAGAKALASFEDLGVQMNRGSTVVSYLHRLLVLLTGSLGKRGTHFSPRTLVDFTNGRSTRNSPVVGARIVGGLVPCNVIADEILTDHEDRYRAMIVEAANPAHSLADSAHMRRALSALDTLVVIDVAMSETAQLADYVLPACSQFEKAEATFFNFEFPANVFHLRPRLLEPLAGTLPEAEIHARLCEALGAFTDEDLAPLRAAAEEGLAALVPALAGLLSNPRLAPMLPVILYRTLPLPAALREGAVLLGIAFGAASRWPHALARAGFEGSTMEAAMKLFEATLASPSGIVFAQDEWTGAAAHIRTQDGKLSLVLPDLLEALGRTLEADAETDPRFPFVLSAGERRSFTANTIIRDPTWRKKDPAGALRISPEDARSLGVSDGESVRLSTRKHAVVVPVAITDSMRAGHVSLPNGLGLGYPAGDGGDYATAGVAPNELTDVTDRDPFVGTPWHKSVPARLERVDAQSGASGSAAAES